jgi:hypothetical protein
MWCEFTYFLVKPISKLDPIAMRSEPIAGPDADTGNFAPARAALTPHLMLSVAQMAVMVTDTSPARAPRRIEIDRSRAA